MKTLFIGIVAFFMMIGTAVAGTYYIEVSPTTATYEQKVEDGVTVFQRSDVSNKGDRMGFSGTSTCQVIDLHKLRDIDGYYTYQFKLLSGVTVTPVAGTTVSVHWKGSNVDTTSAWAFATKNTVINGVDARTGITSVGYDMNDITGVTPFRYMRIEFESGISNDLSGAGNLIPIGILQVR